MIVAYTIIIKDFSTHLRLGVDVSALAKILDMSLQFDDDRTSRRAAGGGGGGMRTGDVHVGDAHGGDFSGGDSRGGDVRVAVIRVGVVGIVVATPCLTFIKLYNLGHWHLAK